MLPTTKDLVAGIKGRVLHVSFASHWPDLTDPATAAAPGDNGNSPLEQQLQFATCARLLTFPATNGAAREQLAPEVATSLPTRSADRRTYTFQIAPGYRFSPPSNAPVTATTFKYSIERALSPRLGAGARPSDWFPHSPGSALTAPEVRPTSRASLRAADARDSPGTPGARLPEQSRPRTSARPDRHPSRLPSAGRSRLEQPILRRPVLLDR